MPSARTATSAASTATNSAAGKTATGTYRYQSGRAARRTTPGYLSQSVPPPVPSRQAPDADESPKRRTYAAPTRAARIQPPRTGARTVGPPALRQRSASATDQAVTEPPVVDRVVLPSPPPQTAPESAFQPSIPVR